VISGPGTAARLAVLRRGLPCGLKQRGKWRVGSGWARRGEVAAHAPSLCRRPSPSRRAAYAGPTGSSVLAWKGYEKALPWHVGHCQKQRECLGKSDQQGRWPEEESRACSLWVGPSGSELQISWPTPHVRCPRRKQAPFTPLAPQSIGHYIRSSTTRRR
jgi:hypothetical protein